MIFTTFQFLLFFAAVFSLLFTLPKRGRPPMLLIASYYFYMCSVPWYLSVIVAITLIDFFAGIRIEEAPSRRSKQYFLAFSIVCNFGLLFALKYAGFFADSVNALFGIGLPVLRFVLPLGISFHTFQAVSYTVEVYRGRTRAERNLLRYALYVAFFPQMVAGPIERPYNLLPQFHKDPALTFDRLTSGLRLVLWGIYKKAVVADLLAPAVNTVYSQPRHFSGPVLILATFFFAIEIYCDFSGYSDIAIGIARMMGYDLMVNFRQPYLARSVGEFWRRWHISLSTWFRDYLYIPLGGSLGSASRYYLNVLIVFLVSGFWHGANWTFAMWGAMHGIYLLAGSITAPLRNRLKASLRLNPSGPLLGTLQVLTTFSFVTVAWVFFRAADVRDGFFIVSHMFQWRGFLLTDVFSLGLPRFEMLLAMFLIGSVAATDYVIAFEPPLAVRLWASRPFRWSCCYGCVFATIFLGVFSRIEFIYFQF
jgi:alginate O-acetyltransferase complex protein AlgI